MLYYIIVHWLVLIKTIKDGRKCNKINKIKKHYNNLRTLLSLIYPYLVTTKHSLSIFYFHATESSNINPIPANVENKVSS